MNKITTAAVTRLKRLHPQVQPFEFARLYESKKISFAEYTRLLKEAFIAENWNVNSH